MSQTKKYGICLFCFISLICFFMFGCENKTPVEDISFKLDSGEQIVLVVGQVFDLKDHVEIKPSYATNKSYTITSFNEGVVRVEGSKLIAVKEDKAVVKVVSNDNPTREDMMTVVVKSTQEQLAAPLNLEYDSQNQLFKFDPVLYASSYTLKINGVEIDLGNSTVYDMNQYGGDIFDKLLIAQVKANAPEYSFAVTTSNYSSEKMIYQAGPVSDLRVVGGKLMYNKFASTSINNVYLDEELFVENFEGNNLSLALLNESCAGETLNVSVKSVVPQDIRDRYGNNVEYYDSILRETKLDVLGIPELTMAASTVSWQNVSHSAGYDVYVDGVKKITTGDNFFDLKSMVDYDQLINPGIVHEIKVLPVLSNDSVGVGKSTKENELRIERLAQTNITCDGTNIGWSEIDNVSLYAISLVGTGVDWTSSTELTHISMKNQLAGEYTISVTAMAQEQPNADGVYFLTSKTTQKTFVKHAALDARIEDYILKIENLENGIATIDFDTDEFDTTVNGSVGVVNYLNLTTYQFAAGDHSITLTRLGDASSVDSAPVTIEFVQLEKINDITINNGVVRVARSEINADATIRLITSGGDLTEEILVDNISYTYNTENPEGDNFLKDGNYQTAVQVLGNGRTTLSYRESGVIVDCAVVDFEVLPAPTAEMTNTAEAKLAILGDANIDRFDVYRFDGENYSLVENVSSNEFGFTLNAGSVTYAVRAIGDGSTYLNSKLSENVTITKLETPSLAFDNITGVISKADTNLVDVVSHYVFKHNGEIVSYDFSSPFVVANQETGNAFTLKAAAILGGDGEFYLDSNEATLNLNHISNEATIELSGLQNNLIIVPQNHNEQYDLVINFGLVHGDQTFETKVEEGTGRRYLSNGFPGADEITLEYSYDYGRYVVVLIDSSHNAIIRDMTQEFTAKVRFVKPSTGNDTLINSVFSEETTLNLNIIDNESIISVNSQNQIILMPTNHPQEFGVVAYIKVSPTLTYIVESNGENKLMCNRLINNGVEISNSYPLGLNYSYRMGSYYIETMNENNEFLISELSGSFEVQIQYSFEHNAYVAGGKKTDLDSFYTNSKSISIQPETTITRDAQTIKILNVKNTYTYLDYSLLVNGHFVALDETATNVEGYIVVDIDYIYENTPAEHLLETNAIEIFVENNETNEETPILARKSGEIKIARTNTVVLSSYKFNNNEDGKDNNSAVVKFEIETTSYDKKYVVKFYDTTTEMIHFMTLIDSDSKNGIVEFNMDEIEKLSSVNGNIRIVAVVETQGRLDDVEMFDSIDSNALILNKVGVTTSLRVSDSTLFFDSVPNSVGYEIWEVTGTGNVKFSEHLITGNSYEIKGLTSQKKFVVKAISRTDGFTNSTYSEQITVSKIKSPTVSVVDGKFKIAFDMSFAMLMANPDLTLRSDIVNASGINFSFGFDDLDGEDVQLKMEGFNPIIIAQPYKFLTYSGASLVPETVTMKIVVNQTAPVNGGYYLNSDEIVMDCYGLFMPSEVKKIADNNNSVEMISWTPSAKNVVLGESVSTGYIFKIEYFDGETTYTYYSDDRELKYFTGGSYASYPQFISGTSAIFPVGYGLNDDGSLKVTFGAGTYKISVQAVPLSTISGYNLFSSKFTNPCEFEVMQSSTLTVVDGKLSWNEQAKANHYEISIYDRDGSTLILTETTEITEYDLNHTKLNDLVGVYQVQVKAISTREDTLNSSASESLFIYKLPKAESVTVDDGQFVLHSTAFFNKAIVELTDTQNPSNKHTFIIDNSETLSETLLPELSIEDWTETTGVEETIINLSHAMTYKLENIGLNITDGRDYTINVKLYGNTHEKLGLISSATATNVSNMTATKLKASAVEVGLGVVQFKPNSEYATISEAGVYTTVVDLNYSFNDATSSEFWHNTMLYKIVVTNPIGAYDVYVVDYYSLKTAIANGTIDASEYQLITAQNGLYAWVIYSYIDEGVEKKLYFNVFDENKIDLRNYDTIARYTITESWKNGKFYLSCDDGGTSDDISLVGTIQIAVHALGGDCYDVSGNVIAHLTSQAKELNPFQKYDSNTLTTIDGKLKFDNLQPVVDGNVIDNPVYKIEVSLFNSFDKQLFYIYYTTEEDARKITTKHDPSTAYSATYLQIENEEGTVYFEENYIVFDLTKYIDFGTYVANIRTLAGLGVGEVNAADYYVNAKLPEGTEKLFKLSDTQFSFGDGKIQFPLSYIVNDGKQIYYYDYEITIKNNETGEDYTYQIGQSTTGVEVDLVNHVMTYIVPDDIDGFSIPNGKEFAIKVRAIATGSLILNGTYKTVDGEDVIYTFEKSMGVEDVRLEDGLLKWKVVDSDNYACTIIKLSFNDSNNEPVGITIKVEDATKMYDEDGNYLYHYYEFTDDKYRLDTTGFTEIKDKLIYNIPGGGTEEREVSYSISLATKGQIVGSRNILNSNYSSSITTSRLSTTNVSNIISNDGILVWDEVANASYYDVVLKGTKTYKFTVDSTLINFLETGFEIDPGEYSIQIKAHKDGFISSMWTKLAQATGFVQLSQVDFDSIKIEDGKIVWAEVEGADAYRVVFEYTDTEGVDHVLTPEPTSDNFFTSPGGISGKFTIKISPLSVGHAKAFNGHETSFTSSTDSPSQVESFEFNSLKNRLEIVVDESKFLNNDIIMLKYDFEEYLADEETISRGTQNIQIEYRKGSFEILGEGKVKYYYPLTVMGKYTSISAMVTRTNTLPSNSLQIVDIDINLFNYGAGTEQNPYRISEAQHLLNIASFTSSHYVLISSVNLSCVNVAERISEHGAIICENFYGTIDGGNGHFGISGFNMDYTNKVDVIELQNGMNFALFKKLNGATIKNLTIGTENIQLILQNMFAKDVENMINLSMIATGAKNTTIDTVNILNLKVVVQTSNNHTLDGAVKIAGFVVDSQETIIKNSRVDLTIEINANCGGNVYLGGLIASVDNSNTSVQDSEIEFNVSTNKDRIFTYLGGAVAYFVSPMGATGQISNVNAEVNIINVAATYQGGLVGFAKFIEIKDSTTSGTMEKSDVNYNTYIGGIVGSANGTTISSCGTEITFKKLVGSNYVDTITVANTENKFIGAIVGQMLAASGVAGTISNCYITHYDTANQNTTCPQQTTVTTDNGITIGVYGSIGQNVSCSGCAYKIK